mgnify:CR=1 FL=1
MACIFLASLLLVRPGLAAEDDPTKRGDTALDKGDYAAAVAAYTEAIAKEPKNSQIYVARASATINWVKLRKRSPTPTRRSGSIRKCRCLVRAWLGQVSEASNAESIADLTKAIQLEPKSVRARCCRGRVLTDEGRLDEAIADGTKAIELAPDFADGYATRGEALFQKASIEKRSPICRRPSGSIKNFGVLIAPAARIWSYWKDPERALEDAEQLIKIDQRVTFPGCIALTRRKKRRLQGGVG